MAQNKFYLSFTHQCNIKEFIYLLFSLLLMFTCVGSGSKTVPSAKGITSTESSIKFSISHLFFLICATTVALTFTTYWSSHLLACFSQHCIPTYSRWLLLYSPFIVQVLLGCGVHVYLFISCYLPFLIKTISGF